MKHGVNREYTITMNDNEARELEHLLYYKIKFSGSGGFTRKLYAFMKTRNDRFPTDVYDPEMIDREPEW